MKSNCLEEFGVEPVKRVNEIIKNVKQKQKENYKNIFLDFLYIYKIYYPENLFTISNNNTLLKIQMIDRKEEEFIKINNNYFKYNNKVFIIKPTYIVYFFRNNLIFLDKNFKVMDINSIKYDGIPIHKNNISPIPSINIPKKILESYGVQKNSENNISLFFNIFNEKFFIRFWKTNLYIDNNSFFIYGGNEKYFFNKELEYIIPNIKQPQKEIQKQENKKTLLDFLPEYPNINKENDWENIHDEGQNFIYLKYKDIHEIQESIPFNVDDRIFSFESANIMVSCNNIRLFTIGKNFSVTYRQTQDNMFSISNYDNLYISDTLLKFKKFIKQENGDIVIYYNILLDYFFIEILKFNLYIQSNKPEPYYFFVIYNNIYIFNHKLIYIKKQKFNYKEIKIINDKLSMENYGMNLRENLNKGTKLSLFGTRKKSKKNQSSSINSAPLSPSSSVSTASMHLSPTHLKKVQSSSSISSKYSSPDRLSLSPVISSSPDILSPKDILDNLDTITEVDLENSKHSLNESKNGGYY